MLPSFAEGFALAVSEAKAGRRGDHPRPSTWTSTAET
jgi:hypothetical protein